MDIVCRRCNCRILAEDINLDKSLAKCRACNSVFDFSLQFEADPSAVSLPIRRRPRVPMPPSIQIVEDTGAPSPASVGDYREAPRFPGRLVLTRRWFTPQYVFMIFFCIAWDSFLVIWYSHAGKGGLLALLFPLGHVAAGVGMTYWTLAGLVNRTWIEVTAGSLSIRHAPLPWRGTREIQAHDIDQLYVKEVSSQGTDRQTSYVLAAMLKNGRQLDLLKLPNAEQALFLEQRLEERLGIIDRPVGGELSA